MISKMQLISVIIGAALFGPMAAYYARRRGHNPYYWFFSGALMGFLGVLVVLMLPKKTTTIAAATPVTIPPPAQRLRSDAWLKNWYYAHTDRSIHGPLDFSLFIEAWVAQKISSRSLVWGEGMEQWRCLEEMPALVTEMTQHAPRSLTQTQATKK